MLTLKEFKEKNKLSNEQLAALIGVSKDTIGTMLKGQAIVRNRERIIPKLKELGIEPPGHEHKEKNTIRAPGELMTINEYYEEMGMTVKGFAKMLDVPVGTLFGWLQGRRVSEEIHEKLKKIGILHPTYKEGFRNNEINAARISGANKKGFLKDFQVVAVEKFGNTIVSKRYSKEAIIDEFAKFDLKVQCREFETYHGSHYVVEVDHKE